MKRLPLFAVAVAIAMVLSSTTKAADVPTNEPAKLPLEKNNNWQVTISNSQQLPSPIWVAIKMAENHWEIDGIYNAAVRIPVTRKVELFMVTRDLQRWTNHYNDMRTDCDTFEVRESDFHSVCTSSLAAKKTGMALAGVLFGRGGKTPFAYTNSDVQAAINSIRPDQATAMLDNFEKKIQETESKAAIQKIEAKKADDDRVAIRKKAPIGAKDWCEQTVKQSGIFLQVDPTYTCQVYGVVNDDILRQEGWAIVNKNTRNIGTPPQQLLVNDISIEKVPR